MRRNRKVIGAFVISLLLLLSGLTHFFSSPTSDRQNIGLGAIQSNEVNREQFSYNLSLSRELNKLPSREYQDTTTGQMIRDRIRAPFPAVDLIRYQDIDIKGTVISLVISKEDLNNKSQGIITNSGKKGINWERPGLLSVYKHGLLILRTRAGVRIHGGIHNENNPASFRLYFREDYDVPRELVTNIIPGAPGVLKQLIINKTDPAFRNAIAFDISRKIGGIAPFTEVASFYLNGSPQGLRLLTEHINIDFFESRFGHRNFTFLRMKGGTRNGHGSRWHALSKQFLRKEKVKFAEVEKVINIENLMRQYAAYLICGTRDAFQGGIIKDDRNRKNPWFFINWDMEDSFFSPTNPNFFKTLGYGSTVPPVLRPLLWKKLSNDPDFQLAFSTLIDNLLDYQLSPDWIKFIVGNYRALAANHKVIVLDEFDKIENFLLKQRTLIRKEMVVFNTGNAI